MGAKGGVTVEFATAERISLAVAVTAQDGGPSSTCWTCAVPRPTRTPTSGHSPPRRACSARSSRRAIISYAVSLRAAVESVKLTATAASAVATVTVEGSTAARP